MLQRPPPVRVLITGFEPFPGVPENASSLIVSALQNVPLMPGITLLTGMLPVVWDTAPALAQQAIAKYKPHAVLHFGVSKQAAGFEIETRCFNLCGPKEDQVGQRRAGHILTPGQPGVMAATLDPAGLLRALKAAGHPASLSRDPGRYLCNAVLWSTLADSRSSGYPLATFVHIPALGVETSVASKLTLESLNAGARILIRASAQAVLRASRFL